jgi:hypothetical protein
MVELLHLFAENGLEDSWGGLISESRRKEKGIPIEEIKAGLIRSGPIRE